jgi:shikimate dehydrogenase
MLKITGKTKLLGIIGNPIEHSLSPVMQNEAIKALGLDYVYIPFPVKADRLSTVLNGFSAIDLVGFNVTIPHKQAIIPLLDEVTNTAKMIGAVNTVWRTETGWKGTNTDIDGFIAPLRQIKHNWSQVCPIILGNGGAARAVVVGCAELGCSEISIIGRNQEKLDLFCQSWQNTPLKSRLKAHSWNNLAGLVSSTDLLINTTPIGMYPHVDQSPLDLSMMDQLKEGTIVYDLIYTPRPTLLLQKAQERGAIVIDGVEMLVQQGAKALEIWVKQPAPVDVMRSALLEFLGFST